MSMMDWFKRKAGPRRIGRSPGGSDLLKYDTDESRTPQIGFLEESTLANTEERERIYQELLGKFDTVLHEFLPLVPHIDVYRIPPTDERKFFTFVTGGMSDLPMNTPANVEAEYRRAEIVFYAAEDRKEFSSMLRHLAHFVHDHNTWLHWGHTMQNGDPAELLLDTRYLDTFFFMPSLVRSDASLGEYLKIDSEPVQLIWCVPITAAECQLKLDQGTDALYDLFEANQHPFVFAGDRESYV